MVRTSVVVTLIVVLEAAVVVAATVVVVTDKDTTVLVLRLVVVPVNVTVRDNVPVGLGASARCRNLCSAPANRPIKTDASSKRKSATISKSFASVVSGSRVIASTCSENVLFRVRPPFAPKD